MAFFEALQNSSKSHNGDYANGNIVFVKDGFSWPALFFTPFWLIFRGMWLVLVFYIGFSMVFWAVANSGYISESVAFWAQIGLSVIFAYEANYLRKWTLQRSNYNHIGVGLGGNLREAEVDFFSQFEQNTRQTSNEPMVVEPTVAKTSSSQLVVNPVSLAKKTEHQKSHWKVGGKRKADSVVGMFDD